MSINACLLRSYHRLSKPCHRCSRPCLRKWGTTRSMSGLKQHQIPFPKKYNEIFALAPLIGNYVKCVFKLAMDQLHLNLQNIASGCTTWSTVGRRTRWPGGA